MPTDMVRFSYLFVPIRGEWWSFTQKGRKVTTTTITAGVEGQDSEMGEGVDVDDDVYFGLGGKGGVNDYYLNIDWTARRIFCDGFKSDTAVLRYVSSGLVVSGSTYVPQQCEATMDAYINWRKEMINPRSMSMIQYLEGLYKEEIKKLRILNFMPSKDEICDAWDSATTQTVQR
jgi:hypothetical protein